MAGRGELAAAVLRGTAGRAEGAGGVGTTRRIQGAAHLGERTAATRSSTAAREAQRRRLELGESDGGAS
jgi:hypothetical protein